MPTTSFTFTRALHDGRCELTLRAHHVPDGYACVLESFLLYLVREIESNFSNDLRHAVHLRVIVTADDALLKVWGVDLYGVRTRETRVGNDPISPARLLDLVHDLLVSVH